MSLPALTEVWARSQQKGTNLLVMLALANWADENFIAWPSIPAIAKIARTGERNVSEILKKLKTAGEIYIIGKGFRGVNQYLITVDHLPVIGFKERPATISGITPELECTPEPQCGGYKSDAENVEQNQEISVGVNSTPELQCTPVPQCRSPLIHSSGHPCSPVQTTLNRHKKDTKIRASEDFWEDFKKVYPDRGGLDRDIEMSKRLFHKLVFAREATGQEIAEGAKAYRLANAGLAKSDRKTILKATTFLLRKTWREYQPETPFAQITGDIDFEAAGPWGEILENWPDQGVAKSWLYQLKIVMKSANDVELQALSAFHCQYIEQNFQAKLLNAWKAHNPDFQTLTLTVERKAA